ncbi:hypothetical protein [Embleya sp. NPDC001921]
MSRAPGPSKKYADYKPAPQMLDAIKAWEDSVEAEKVARAAARKAVADELKSSGVSRRALARFTPWTEQTVDGIAKEHGAPPVRKPKPDTTGE